MNIRKAKSSDRNKILDFCMNTFEWGDYIDKAWDNWMNDSSGLLLVCEASLSSTSNSDLAAVIHICKCPNNSLWIEGLRVNEIYRNKGIASSLLNYSINYAIDNNLNESCALVSQSNFASQKMLEKSGFSKLFKCHYYNINIKKGEFSDETFTKFTNIIPSMKLFLNIPVLKDIPKILEYLSNAAVSKLMDNRYFDSWRFYKLEKVFLNLSSLINDGKLLMIVNEMNRIVGVTIVNHTDKNNSFYKNSIAQICYLNCFDSLIYLRVIYLLLDKFHNDTRFDNVQLFLPEFIDIRNYLSSKSIDYIDQFYLYIKNLE